MVQLEVREPISETKSAVVILVKQNLEQNDKLRICIDPTVEFTLEEVAAVVSGTKVFLHYWIAKKWFRPILVTYRFFFTTPWGRYSCRQMPFDAAPEIFQEIVLTVLKNFPNVERRTTMWYTMQTICRKQQRQSLKDTEKWHETESATVKFLGHITGQNRLKARIPKASGLKQPNNRKPLRNLMVCIYNKELRQLITTTLVLKLYNVDISWIIRLMPVLLRFGQYWFIMTKKSFSKEQLDNPHIHKEAMVIRYGCREIHDYIYGKKLLTNGPRTIGVHLRK